MESFSACHIAFQELGQFKIFRHSFVLKSLFKLLSFSLFYSRCFVEWQCLAFAFSCFEYPGLSIPDSSFWWFMLVRYFQFSQLCKSDLSFKLQDAQLIVKAFCFLSSYPLVLLRQFQHLLNELLVEWRPILLLWFFSSHNLHILNVH